MQMCLNLQENSVQFLMFQFLQMGKGGVYDEYLLRCVDPAPLVVVTPFFCESSSCGVGTTARPSNPQDDSFALVKYRVHNDASTWGQLGSLVAAAILWKWASWESQGVPRNLGLPW